ncbi:MAG: hypothetical protein KKC18_04690 [Chloroflexi bacterium]|nr:hypothetical protein [Chloroflexota bacterium]
MTKGTDLHHLQHLDSDKDVKQHRLKEIEATLGESETLRQARLALGSAQAQARKWMAQQRNLELEIQGISDETSRSEQRLYSGAVKNPKELSDLQAKIASLRRHRQKLEDNLLEAMIEREEAEATHAQAQEHLSDTESRWSTQQADLLAEREALQEKLAEIEQAQAILLPNIESRDLTTYQNLRRRKGGLAVVQMQSGVCGGCGVAVSPNLEWKLRQGELIQCGNCERIVVRDKRSRPP